MSLISRSTATVFLTYGKDPKSNSSSSPTSTQIPLKSTQSVFNLGLRTCSGIQLTAYISQSGLHGEVIFQQQSGDGVTVRTSLQAIDGQSQWSWSVRELPVSYSSIDDRCGDNHLGSITLNFDDIFGPLDLPANGSTEMTTSNDKIVLTGAKGLWGKSLLLQMVEDSSRMACATITVSGNADEKVAEARFFSPIAGSVFFRWVGSHHSDSTDTLLHTNLYHVVNINGNKYTNTEHNWKIYTTDILDSEADKSRENCNFLQLVFDPVFSTTPGQAVGDLDSRIGKVKVAGDPRSPYSSVAGVYHDSGLTSLSVDLLSGQRSLYLVIFDARHDDSFLACAKIREIHPAVLKALIQSEGVKGELTLSQRSPFDPTWIKINLTSTLNTPTGNLARISSYKIHELPPTPLPSTDVKENHCYKTGSVFNPNNIQEDQASGSQDTYAIGDLSGKHNKWRREQSLAELNGQRWDIYLPLYSHHSVAHRSFVFYRRNNSADTAVSVNVSDTPWICSTLSRYTAVERGWKIPIFTASIVFRYPTVGRIIFRQARDQPWTDTTVIVETLVHGDGTSLNNTADHRWAVHVEPRGTDYYNWTGRCLSAGPIYNPYKVTVDPKESDSLCSLHRPGYCQLGDLSTRHGTLNIAGRRVNGEKLTRRLFTDSLLPLSGAASIMGRSLVLYDDNGPKARGERLACSTVYGIYRRKAVVKDWYGNGQITSVKGKIEFFQQTEYDVTDIEVDLQGLSDNSGYHIHVAPVEGDLEFPCEGSSLYGHWNPLNVNPSLSPPPGNGTTDQYEMGDLSGKFGLLNGLVSLDAVYNDTKLPLFGTHAILGRSVVIHKKEKNMRWTCSSIERGYAPGEARELRAIASFHHPLGYAYGYIRMTQLVYNDDSKSDTVIEVKLRHPGKHDRNLTRNHNWAIYVNPVGVDATVKVQDTRCVAGGYLWNPYYTQLAAPLNDELYREECGPDNPLRCYVGDISGRLGTINLGDKRQVFTDSNFPLGPLANQLEQDFSRLLANGRLAAPSLYNPGYVPSTKRKTQLSYRPCGTRDPNEKS
ncbi:hypothetical protein ANN_20526 [Periplaneta americana]|uniref:Superoxide dismutase copper/zinc binding domain-containing protein n=1 Tax=Periplaneta americana TaxID=6978 RepID=A0ABQ8SCX0_PERAM|nr:hypothetical protein ANN_20526 [Periplaneta americana]